MTGDEQGQRDIEENSLNVWLEHISGGLVGHAHFKEFKRKCKAAITNKLLTPLHDDVDMCCVELGQVCGLELIDERLHICFVQLASLVSSDRSTIAKLIVFESIFNKFN